MTHDIFDLYNEAIKKQWEFGNDMITAFINSEENIRPY
jgi:hypothetical protein